MPVALVDEEEYEIERILRHRKRRGRGRGYEFLVLWKGYDLSNATWVKDVDMGNASDIV